MKIENAGGGDKMKWLHKLKTIVKPVEEQRDKNDVRDVADETMQSAKKMVLPLAVETDALVREASPLSSLTPRERQVFNLLIQGQTLSKIAESLGIKYTTVNSHQKKIYKKLNVNSRVECILRYGLKKD